MSYTLFNSTSAATDLIAQPGRAVNTFPSGLLRVDQVYLGLTANAATHRAILAVGNDMPDGDTSPCIDGLKIFPEVQERRREDGWTEYIVSAYGRSKSTATIESRAIIRTVGTITLGRKSVTAVIVSADFPTFAQLAIPADDFDPFLAYRFDENNQIEPGTLAQGASYPTLDVWQISFPGGSNFTRLFYKPGLNFSPVLEGSLGSIFGQNPGYTYNAETAFALPVEISQRNFGYWSEWIFSYG
jgi:hypothetical protein